MVHGWTSRFGRKYAQLLDGIDKADSVSVSAHKWLFQPKESALILFKNNEAATKEISFGGEYMSSPNIGIQGSRGASAVSLLATIIAWGRGYCRLYRSCNVQQREICNRSSKE